MDDTIIKMEDMDNNQDNDININTELDIVKDNDGYSIRSNGISDYICCHCKKAFVFKDQFIDHNSIRHNDEKPYHCNQCNYSCDRQKSDLTQHIERVHDKKINYRCNHDNCTKEFYHKSNYDIHMKIHTGETPFICHYVGCSYSCTSRSTLKYHIEAGHKKKINYRCDYDGCNKGFYKKSQYVDHMRTHTGERPFRCHYNGCSYSCKQRGNLITHIQGFDKKKINYRCDYDECNKGFYMKSAYVAHLRTHTDERPYKCGLYPLSFRQSGALNKHINIVDKKIKKYQCKYCDKKFGQRSHCKIHERTHTGEKPYRCDKCKRRFISASSRNKHKCNK